MSRPCSRSQTASAFPPPVRSRVAARAGRPCRAYRAHRRSRLPGERPTTENATTTTLAERSCCKAKTYSRKRSTQRLHARIVLHLPEYLPKTQHEPTADRLFCCIFHNRGHGRRWPRAPTCASPASWLHSPPSRTCSAVSGDSPVSRRPRGHPSARPSTGAPARRSARPSVRPLLPRLPIRNPRPPPPISDPRERPPGF